MRLETVKMRKGKYVLIFSVMDPRDEHTAPFISISSSIRSSSICEGEYVAANSAHPNQIQ